MFTLPSLLPARSPRMATAKRREQGSSRCIWIPGKRTVWGLAVFERETDLDPVCVLGGFDVEAKGAVLAFCDLFLTMTQSESTF